MSVTPRGLLVLAALMSGACPVDEEDPGTQSPIDTPASAAAPAAICPEGAPTLGQPGATAMEQVDLAWLGEGAESYVGDYLYFVIPDDILSLLVAVEQGAALTGLNAMAIDGEPLLDLSGEAPFYHLPVAVAAVTMPINAETLPRGGCLAIDPVVLSDVRGETGTLHLVTRRGPSQPSTLDVSVFVVGTTVITDAEVTAAITRMDEVYAGGGSATIGAVTLATLDWPDPFVDSEGAEADQLRALAISDDPGALNLLFVQDFNEVGTLGIAAGIPGPNGISGTAASAVMISVDTHLDADGQTLLTDLMGETMAHELGHQLGLFHTSEADGLSHDPIADTPQCGVESDADGDGELIAEECEAAGGRNLMFWTAATEFGQFELSPTQAAVLRDSVIARPQ